MISSFLFFYSCLFIDRFSSSLRFLLLLPLSFPSLIPLFVLSSLPLPSHSSFYFLHLSPFLDFPPSLRFLLHHSLSFPLLLFSSFHSSPLLHHSFFLLFFIRLLISRFPSFPTLSPSPFPLLPSPSLLILSPLSLLYHSFFLLFSIRLLLSRSSSFPFDSCSPFSSFYSIPLVAMSSFSLITFSPSLLALPPSSFRPSPSPSLPSQLCTFTSYFLLLSL